MSYGKGFNILNWKGGAEVGRLFLSEGLKSIKNKIIYQLDIF